jgi:xanthine/uracil permease
VLQNLGEKEYSLPPSLRILVADGIVVGTAMAVTLNLLIQTNI